MKTDYGSICDRFLEMEDSHKLFEFRVNGVNVWIYMRERIYCEILKQLNTINDSFTDAKRLSSYSDNLFYMFFKMKIYKYIWGKRLKSLSRREILVLTHPRRIKDSDGFYNCTVMDYFLPHVKSSYLVLEEPMWIDSPADYISHYTPTRTENLVYTDQIEFYFELKYRIKRYFITHLITDLEKENIIRLIELINNIFDVQLDRKKYLEMFIKFTYYEKLTMDKYAEIIDRVNPRLILEYYSPTRTKQIINRIAHKKSIVIADLQHGMFGKSEPLMVNYHKKIDLDNFPDKILLFGDYWSKKARFPIDKENIISVGYPYFENKIERLRIINSSNQKKYITFFSQGKIGIRFSKLAAELSELIQDSGFSIVFKTHPFEHKRWEIDYPWLNKKNIIVADDNLRDIYYYLEQTAYQVGVYSTAVFEGIALNIPTFIFNDYGSNELKDIYDNFDNIYLVSNAEDIWRCIIKRGKECKPANDGLSLDLFKRNAIDNINSFINEYVIKKGDNTN